MTHLYYHSLSGVKKWGGSAQDYLPIHSRFDESKKIIADFRHRALRHHAEGIFIPFLFDAVTYCDRMIADSSLVRYNMKSSGNLSRLRRTA